MTQSELSLLDIYDRILLGGKVREEHVWSYVKLTGGVSDRTHPCGKRLRVLMEADAILEALLLLANELEPPADLRMFHRVSYRWVCSAARGSSLRLLKVSHPTLEGAILLTLLRLAGNINSPDRHTHGAIS